MVPLTEKQTSPSGYKRKDHPPTKFSMSRYEMNDGTALSTALRRNTPRHSLPSCAKMQNAVPGQLLKPPVVTSYSCVSVPSFSDLEKQRRSP